MSEATMSMELKLLKLDQKELFKFQLWMSELKVLSISLLDLLDLSLPNIQRFLLKLMQEFPNSSAKNSLMSLKLMKLTELLKLLSLFLKQLELRMFTHMPAHDQEELSSI
jgi:hypothetical protein